MKLEALPAVIPALVYCTGDSVPLLLRDTDLNLDTMGGLEGKAQVTRPTVLYYPLHVTVPAQIIRCIPDRLRAYC